MSNTNNISGLHGTRLDQLHGPLLFGLPTTKFDFDRNFQPGGQQPPSPWANRPWHQRPRSPGLKWHKEYDTPESLKRGRVLLIDYAKQDPSKEGVRKVVAQEINDLEGLRKLYSNQDVANEHVLRVIHLQNAPWAIGFLLQKFNITTHDEILGTFGQFVKNKRPERRSGKPFLNGRSWTISHDPWRKISQMSFGIDYLKHYENRRDSPEMQTDFSGKLMDLNCYDDVDSPICGFDVYAQRLCCYVQHREVSGEINPSPSIEDPYLMGENHLSRLRGVDNGNTVIIFEDSHSGSIEDTMISARQKYESRWRRLPFYLAYESKDVSDDDLMAVECIKLILQDVWKSVAESWEVLLDVCRLHVSILEDKIYEEPADETRAPELWTNSSMWLKLERIIWIHSSVVKETQSHLRELTGELVVEDDWLETGTGDMERLSNMVQEELVKPTASLADLMYKSVEIRDSRHSLQLNTSMWRLSWITFIFLPLTFLVGFFGMNVDTFKQDPNIKWYFIAAVPMMALVLILWYAIKHYLSNDRQTPYQRGMYEHFFHDLAEKFPRLWSVSGPRNLVRPESAIDRLKWRLVLYWNSPGKTIKAGRVGQDAQYDDDLGAWSRCKRILTRRWTSQIQNNPASNIRIPSAINSLEDGVGSGAPALTTGAGEASELLPIPTSSVNLQRIPQIHSAILKAGTILKSQTRTSESSRPGSPAERLSSKDSSGGKRNSGVMVEEERTSWLKELGERSHGSYWKPNANGKRASSIASAPVPEAGAGADKQ